MVTVNAQPKDDGWVCEVVVDHAGAHAMHSVRVSRKDVERWAWGSDRKDVESLVARSFEFLLEREPPNAILSTFDLSVIQRYFPEYDSKFRNKTT